MKELPAAAAQSLALNERTLEGLIDRMLWGFALMIGAAGAALMLLLMLAKRLGFFASQPTSDSMLPEAPKVVAKT